MEVDPNVIISTVALIIAIFGVGISTYLTRQSNELVRKDLNVRLRPWIKIESCKPEYVIFDDGSVVNWNQRGQAGRIIISVRIVTTFSNIGTIPCRIISNFAKLDKLMERDFTKVPEIKDAHSMILMPNTSSFKHFDIKYDEWVNVSTNPLFFGLWLRYQINDKLDAELGQIWEMFKGGNFIRNDWYDEKPPKK